MEIPDIIGPEEGINCSDAPHYHLPKRKGGHLFFGGFLSDPRIIFVVE